MSALLVGDQVVAAIWGLGFRKRCYSLLQGYEVGEWSRLSPGRLLMEDLVEWCIDRRADDVFDLTVGDEDYKRFWADHSLALYDVVAARSLRGQAFLAAREVRRRLKDSDAIRAFVHRLRGSLKKS